MAFDLRSDGHEFYLHVSTIKIFTLDMLPQQTRTPSLILLMLKNGQVSQKCVLVQHITTQGHVSCSHYEYCLVFRWWINGRRYSWLN
jgi:hypothetical protein